MKTKLYAFGRRLPYPLKHRLKLLSPVGWFVINMPRWVNSLLAGVASSNGLAVCYGYDYIPKPTQFNGGGKVKLQRLQEVWPNSPNRFNMLYMVSSSAPTDWQQLMWIARCKKAKVVWNQNGVAYAGWHGPGWERINQPMAHMLRAADYVFYQSRFCKLSADRLVYERQSHWEILYNAVDTTVFTPAVCDPDPRHLTLLLGGNQYQLYRLECALRTLAKLTRDRPDVLLLVTGRLKWMSDESDASCGLRRLIAELKIGDRVQFLGPYTQAEAPAIMRKAHILLHTKYNDPSPGLVVEAMACGLPVVYSRSGGVPELVGDEAGIGIPAELSWERDIVPDPQALAEAVLQVAEKRQHYAEAARQRAVECFDLRPWIERHRIVFESLLE